MPAPDIKSIRKYTYYDSAPSLRTDLQSLSDDSDTGISRIPRQTVTDPVPFGGQPFLLRSTFTVIVPQDTFAFRNLYLY